MTNLMYNQRPEQDEQRVGRKVDDPRQIIEQRLEGALICNRVVRYIYRRSYKERLSIEIEVHKEVVLILAAIDKVDNGKEHCAH